MFGKSKKKQQAAAAQQMQVSPEALALLQAMQAQQLQAQQLQAQQLQAQQLQAQQLQAQQMQMPQQPMMQQPMMQQPMMQQTPPPQPQAPTLSDQDLAAELGGAMPAMAGSPEMMQQQAMPDAMAQQPAIAPLSPQDMANAPVASTGFPFTTEAPAVAEEPVNPKKKSKLTKDEKRILAEQKKAEKERKKAEKKAQLLEKSEEKKRAKRRKKLAKTRFSRARYLREASGNAIAGATLWIFVIIAFIVGPFLLNTAFLIPQTNENMRILAEAESLKRSIVTNRPQITAMAEKRKQKNNQINAFASSFTPRNVASQSLQDLALQLEDVGLEVEPITISSAALSAQSIIGTTATFTLTGNYLDWLRVRNKFVRAQNAISIPIETIAINEETGQMEIIAQIILPSRP